MKGLKRQEGQRHRATKGNWVAHVGGHMKAIGRAFEKGYIYSIFSDIDCIRIRDADKTLDWISTFGME